MSLPKLMNVLTPQGPKPHKDMDRERLEGKIVKYTDYILDHNFWIYRRTCLKRSLVLYHFLRRCGIDVHVCFGVRYNENMPNKKEGKNLEGHAWLLYKENIFLEKKADLTRTYRITYSFPGDKASFG